MSHLTINDYSGFFHHTLTDAQRETMDRHLQSCATCRAQLDQYKWAQRHITNGLDAALRPERPSTQLRFQTIRLGLNRQRKWANVRFWGLQVLVNMGAFVLVAGLALLAFAYISRLPQQADPAPAQPQSTAPTPTSATATDIDLNLFRQGLISTEQMALSQFQQAPYYQLAIEINQDLTKINTQERIQYINRTGETLSEIYLSWPPRLSDSRLHLTEAQVNGRSLTQLSALGAYLLVPLADPLPPGERLDIALDFTIEIGQSRQAVPGELALIEDVLTLNYFYPMVAPFRDGVWQLQQPAYGMSIPPDKSFYEIRIDAPEQATVVASGIEVGRSLTHELDGTHAHIQYVAGPISHFFLSVSNRFTAVFSETVGETNLHSYVYDPTLIDEAQNALEIAVQAVENYNALFGPYPYVELDLVGTPTRSPWSSNSYLGISLLGYDSQSADGDSLPHSVSRAIAYHWFGHLVGTNLLQEPWLAQSVSSYSTRYALPQQTAVLQTEWRTISAQTALQPIGMQVSAYTADSYFTTIYGLGPTFLVQLAEEMGEATFTQFLQRYYQQQRWANSTNSSDFKQLAELTCDCNLSPLFASWVYPTSEKKGIAFSLQ